jgi:hypothetical protein
VHRLCLKGFPIEGLCFRTHGTKTNNKEIKRVISWKLSVNKAVHSSLPSFNLNLKAGSIVLCDQ